MLVCIQDLDDIVDDCFFIQSFFNNNRVIQMNLIIAGTDNQFFNAVFSFQYIIQTVAHGSAIKISAVSSFIHKKLRVMCSTVVGGHEYSVISFPYMLIKKIVKISQILIKSQIVIFNFHGIYRILVADIIGSRKT